MKFSARLFKEVRDVKHSLRWLIVLPGMPRHLKMIMIKLYCLIVYETKASERLCREERDPKLFLR